MYSACAVHLYIVLKIQRRMFTKIVMLQTIEIDTLEYQQTEKIETELKDVDRIHRIRKVYAS